MSRRCAWQVLLAILLITAGPMLIGNVIAERGGLLDDPLLDANDPMARMDRRARALAAPGLHTGEAVAFLIRLPNGIDGRALLQIAALTRQVKAAFPDYGILSLASLPWYRDDGNELLSSPYIDQALLERAAVDPAMDLSAWKTAISQDAGVYGVLVGRAFDYALVDLLLPEGTPEIAAFRRVVEFVEQRTIPAWEWYFKSDITPAAAFSGVEPAGWVFARGLMDAALTADILRLTSIGLAIVAGAFFLCFLSLRQAAMATLVVLLVFLWVRGSLGLVQAAGFPVYERVYFLLVYTAVIVSGISFVERKASAYHEVRAMNPGMVRSLVWSKARGVNRLIVLTGLIAVLNFGTLFQIGVRGILEVGLFSALGILYLWVVVLVFLPAVHILAGGDADDRPEATGAVAGIGRVWQAVLRSVVDRCRRLLGDHPHKPLPWRRSATGALAVTLALVAAAGVGLAAGFLVVRTNPLEFIRATVVYRASTFLNQAGRTGFDRLSVLVAARTAAAGDGSTAAVTNPDFLATVAQFQAEARTLSSVREVTSVLDMVHRVAAQSYQLDLPQTPQQAHDILQTVEWDLGPALKDQFWNDRAIAVFMSTAMDDSNSLGRMTEDVLALAARFPTLEVLPFGKIAIYPQTDRYIREGKPWNALSSLAIVMVLCGVWVGTLQRRPQPGARAVLRLSRWRTGLVIGLPFLFASAVILLVMMALDVPLDQATACITALAVNAAIDFSLYLIADYQEALQAGGDRRTALQTALGPRGTMIVIDIVLNTLCFAPLLVSNFLPVMRLGWVMIVMLLACGVGALLVLPALLPWCVRPVQAVCVPAADRSAIPQ